MINNDSIVTAYDEHLTLVEWLQKVEKLVANGGLKSTALNDKGNATFSLTLTFNDDTTITSPDMTLTSVNEALTALNNEVDDIKDGSTHLFENITDSHGNKRFIEGNITMETISGVTQTYGKWSLSGTHLMIVVCADVANGTTIPLTTYLCTINLPSYIKDKINPVYSEYVERKEVPLYSEDHSTQTINVGLRKETNAIRIRTTLSSITLTAKRSFRIQFDLLIDNE